MFHVKYTRAPGTALAKPETHISKGFETREEAMQFACALAANLMFMAVEIHALKREPAA